MNIEKKRALLGAHMSIAGSIKNALIAGESIGCTAIQIFTANNRQWSINKLSEQAAYDFVEYKNNSSIKQVISHSSYLINLGSPNKLVVQKSKEALLAELTRCDQLQIPYTVMHPGASLKTDEQECLDRIAENISQILLTHQGTCSILLENTAGQGSTLGHSFEQLAYIRNNVALKNRIGICFDTCHTFAAGYKFQNKENYQNLWKNFDQVIGLDNLKVLHLNDSKKECGLKIDRHEHIGKGKIGELPFHYIMNDPNFIHLPKIIETPKEKNLLDDVKNLETLKNMIL